MSEFLPGHDQKLRISIENRVGGILPLRSLIEVAEAYVNGEISGDSFTQSVRKVFSRIRSG